MGVLLRGVDGIGFGKVVFCIGIVVVWFDDWKMLWGSGSDVYIDTSFSCTVSFEKRRSNITNSVELLIDRIEAIPS